MKASPLLFLVAVVLAVAALLAQPPAARPVPANNYVDPAKCAVCHAAIAETYRKTGMGRSFYRLTSDTVMENFSKPYFHEPSGTWLEMVERAGKYFQRRWQAGPDGKEANVDEKSVDFVLGSGNHARTYLHVTGRNTVQELPLGWYSEKGGFLAMNPGYDRPDYSGSVRALHYECMFCHNGYPKIPRGHDDEGAESQFTMPLPEGIDCQRCHGPGQRHIETVARPGATTAQIRAAIVNPVKLTPEREMEVCMQCHLETTTLALPHSMQRPGRAPFSYVPGQPLGDFRTAWDRTEHDDERFEVAEAAYGLRRSPCFLKSEGKLRCTTCHDPHDVPRGDAAVTHYNGVCRQCHSTGDHMKSGDCTSCHMPRVRTDDAIHIVMTDHFIRRRPPADRLGEKPEFHETPETAYRGEVAPYYPAMTPKADDQLAAAVTQLKDRSNLKEGLVRLAALIAKFKPVRADYYTALADGYKAAGDMAKAIPLYAEAARRAPTSSIVLSQYGNALMEARQSVKAEEVLRRATVLAPNDPLVWGLLGKVLAQEGKGPAAKLALERALKLDPELPEPHNYLGAMLVGAGDMKGAEREFREAVRLLPGVPEWQSNLAGFLASVGQIPEATFLFERTIRLFPAFVPAKLNYARLLANTGAMAEAEKQAQAAIEVDPKFVDLHEFLGALYSARGAWVDAVRELQAAVNLDGNSSRAQFELGVAMANSGAMVGATIHLKAAAEGADPQVAEQARQMLRRIGR